jgi:hypothetical protein
MNITKLLPARNWLALLLCTFISHSIPAAIIYDNSTTPEEIYSAQLTEHGDEITLAGSDRLLTDFAFEYYADYTPSGDESARLRLYLNDAAPGDNPGNTPGTLLYDSGLFSIATNYHTVHISDLALFLPGNSLTWTVEFNGIDANGTAGLLFYNPPTTGSSDDYYWQKNAGVWEAVQSEGTGNNFAAQLIAQQVVRISGVQKNGSELLITADAVSGKSYALEVSANLVDWVLPASPIPASSDSVQFTVPMNAPYQFFRVVQI